MENWNSSAPSGGDEEEMVECEGMIYRFDREKRLYCVAGYTESRDYSQDDWTYPEEKEVNPPARWFELKVNTNVYVTGLPLDVKDEEIVSVFSRCGFVKKDPETKQFCVKIYLDKGTGEPKGDARVRYLKEASVDLAIQILDGTPLRSGDKILMSVTRAKFEQKGNIYVPKKIDPKVEKLKKQRLRHLEYKLLGWGGRDDSRKQHDDGSSKHD